MDQKKTKDGKRDSMQRVIKKSLGSYTNIRQNRLKKKKCCQRQRRTFQKDKGSSHPEDITMKTTYAPNNGTAKYIKQKLTELKGKQAIQQEQ